MNEPSFTRDPNVPLLQKALEDIRRTASSRFGSRNGKLSRIIAICDAVETTTDRVRIIRTIHDEAPDGIVPAFTEPDPRVSRRAMEAELIGDRTSHFDPHFDL